MKRIKFQGNEYLLINGVIATPEQFHSFAPSYAAIRDSDGAVMRYGEKIGHQDEIEVLDENPTVEYPDPGVAMNVLMDVVLNGIETFKNREAK